MFLDFLIFCIILLKYGFDRYGPDIIEDAWQDFILDFDREYDPNSHEHQLFFPWLLYTWLPGIEDEDDSDSGEWSKRY